MTEPAVCVIVPVPVEVNVTEVVPVTLAPSARLPFAAVDLIVRLLVDDTTPVVLRFPAADKVKAPAVAVKPDELKFVVFVIVPLPNVPDTATAPPEFATVAAPVVLSTSVVAWEFKAPIAPVPPFRVTVGAITLPADCVMVPVPVAVRVTAVVPDALAPRAMLPFAAVDFKSRLVVDETTPVVVRLPAEDNVSAPAVAVSPELLMSVLLVMVPEPVVPDSANTPPEFVIVVAPVLLRTMTPA